MSTKDPTSRSSSTAGSTAPNRIAEPARPTAPDQPATPDVQHRLTDLDALLDHLVDAKPLSVLEPDRQNQLVHVRLGIASGLYTTLKIRHNPTAEHSLRVALGCSSWAFSAGLDQKQRDEIEVAALLHDIGKIATPDSILRSTQKMSSEEASIMANSRRLSRFVLASCCQCSIPTLVEYAAARFDGVGEYDRLGKDLPLGSRMIAIVDAFDSMTTEQAYRKAMSIDRAVAELFKNAGTQFDPDLVQQFGDLLSNQTISLRDSAVKRWFAELTAEDSNGLWCRPETIDRNVTPQRQNRESLFFARMMESMSDGVIFVDHVGTIIRWSPGAEQLTQIASKSVVDRQWTPKLLGLRTTEGAPIEDDECPVLHAITTGTQSMNRYMFKGLRDRYITIDLHVVPVLTPDGQKCGATIIARDASPEANLEERVQTLHEKATRDALTSVSNRAEFDRQMIECVEQNESDGSTFSLIISDIDHFKAVNDTYGHQAGDEVLVQFAALMQRSCRQGDIVARYGGEEFVIICKNCPSSSATDLAEKIRSELAEIPQTALNGKMVTSSFGVTELQPGDTAETILRRADRALYKAKDGGRNRVVQLGVGMNVQEDDENVESAISTWWNALTTRSVAGECLIDCHLATNVPVNVAVEKLRGFLSDHEAEIVSVSDEEVTARIQAPGPNARRTHVGFAIEMSFIDRDAIGQGDGLSHPPTVIRVQISPVRGRERRNNELVSSAKTLVRSLRSYLMASRYDMRNHRTIGE